MRRASAAPKGAAAHAAAEQGAEVSPESALR